MNSDRGTWQLEWCEDGLFYEVGRASIVTFQTAMNPFTIFVVESAFKFKSIWGLIHTLFFVILADGAFLFGVFAIRKQLKFS